MISISLLSAAISGAAGDGHPVAEAEFAVPLFRETPGLANRGWKGGDFGGRPTGIPSELRVRRGRPVGLDPKVADGHGFAAGDAIRLNLFEGRESMARVDHVSADVNGTVTVRARIDGSRWGHLLMSTTGGRTLGVISIPEKGELYRVQSNGAGHYLVEVDREEDMPRACEAIAPSYQASREPAGIEGMDMGAQSAADPWEEVTVDVMVAYTPAARQWADASGGGMFNVIAQSMAKANLALENSETHLSLNLVMTAEVDYTESGNSRVDLIRLTTSPHYKPYGDVWNGYDVSGYMDGLHQLRDESGADLVALFASVEDTGGLAWVLDSSLGRADWGFGLTRVQQASSSFTHAHELGHNLGLHHHREQTVQPGPGLFDYSAGWRWVGADSTAYCSVMTYGGGTNFTDGRTHLGVAHFSNPAILHSGTSSGDASHADNARTLRETKHVVAAYRSRGDISLGEAVGRPEWAWLSGGDAPWSVQAVGFDNGGSAAQSGQIPDSGQSWLETKIDGPGVLQFRWKVSSERNYDFLTFSVGAEEKDRVTGEADWELKSYLIAAGTHTVRWVYTKDSTQTAGADGGWLNQVVWTPGPVEPSTYAAWRGQTSLPEHLREVDDDPGGSGILNWHRYAFGLDPVRPERSGLPALGILRVADGDGDHDYLTISFSKAEAASDIVYRPQASGDLVHWESLAAAEFLVDSTLKGNRRHVTYRDRVPIVEAGARYLRVGIVSLLGEAIGQPDRDWLTGGNASWSAQGEDSFDGGSAVRSGSISHNQQTWLETAVEGPGAIAFRWKISSEAGWDLFRFWIAEGEVASISGEVDWSERTFLVPAGRHTLRWRYTKDGTVSEGRDAAWLDRIVWTPDPG